LLIYRSPFGNYVRVTDSGVTDSGEQLVTMAAGSAVFTFGLD
jgi:hypothetical protein